MGIAPEIVEHLAIPGERGLGIDDPVLLAQRREIIEEGLALTQWLELTEELHLAPVKELLELFEEGVLG